MKDFLLFVDTETTGLPQNWQAPYERTDLWPSAVQIAWVICNRDGRELKRENFYISDNDIPVSDTSLAIHKLDSVFLTKNGLPRKEVMGLLAQDLWTYEPLIIGHYMQFDYAVIRVDFERAQITNNLPSLPLFCTMLASRVLVRGAYEKYMRLEELYATLFQKKSPDLHDAMQDAVVTARCFFEMWNSGFITEQYVDQQQVIAPFKSPPKVNIYLMAGLLILLFLLCYVFFQKN
ncbi:DNA polymerase-3 subunit epsilon [bacterium A37T11]|nr:DNA polymerase-3 subunit epsilon [bacterium A37T11]